MADADPKPTAALASLFEDSPAMVGAGYGPQLIIEFVNKSLRDAIGKKRSVVGRPIREALPELERQGLMAIAENVMSTGQAHFASALEVGFDTEENGKLEMHYLSFTLQPIRDAQGQAAGLLIHGTDVTDQILTRREVEATRRRYIDLIESMDAVVWEGDVASGRYSFVSKHAEVIFGYPLQAWTTFDWTMSLLDAEDRPSVLQAGETAVREGHSGFRVQYRVTAADGRQVWVQNSVRIVRGEAGEAVALRGVIVDITPLKNAETEREQTKLRLAELQKLESLGMLAGGIAHDFNNLLTAMLGNASVAERHLGREHVASAAVRDIVDSAKKAADLTAQLVAYAGHGSFEPKRIDLSSYVRETQALLHAMLPSGARLEVDVVPELPPIRIDVSSLQQILLNLVMGAGEALAGGPGQVWVRTGLTELEVTTLDQLLGGDGLDGGSFAYLEVVDDGPPLDEDLVRQLKAGAPLESKGRRAQSLGNVLKLVQTHQGAVEIDSAHRGRTYCRVYLPVAGRPSRPDSQGALEPIGGVGAVLIIDDEIWVRGTTRRMLEHLGYSVIEAWDGPSGIATFRERQSELVAVLLDLTMPDMGGEQVFHELRRIAPEVPVVISSGFSEAETDWVAEAGRSVAFLEKPYTLERLGALLAEVVSAGPAGT
ncbi:MAG: PAS domain S-box protein [Myxococcota bacterium]